MKITCLLLLFNFFLFSPIDAHSTVKKHSERWYQEKYCKGKIEVTLQDKTRCDCLTDTHAIEFDFASKWYQAIGQSLHYARLTKKIPGIYLIIKNQKDEIYLDRLLKTIEHYNLPIDVFYNNIQDLKKVP